MSASRSGWAANLREIAALLSSGVPAAFARTDLYAALRRRLSATPKRFEPPGRFEDWRRGESWRHRKLVVPETDLVVEGFPGSGNSFVSNSLRHALDERLHVTSHFHHTVQLKRALAFGVPALVVVREPLAAAGSWKSKQPALWDALILWRWVVFHHYVWRHRDRLDVFLFDEVVRDLDLVRRRSRTLGRLLSAPLVPDSAYRRRSERRTEIRRDRLVTRLLLRRARSLYRRLVSAARGA